MPEIKNMNDLNLLGRMADAATSHIDRLLNPKDEEGNPLVPSHKSINRAADIKQDLWTVKVRIEELNGSKT